MLKTLTLSIKMFKPRFHTPQFRCLLQSTQLATFWSRLTNSSVPVYSAAGLSGEEQAEVEVS